MTTYRDIAYLTDDDAFEGLVKAAELGAASVLTLA